jgi:membrane protease YdiL (CAAX protease family)
MTTVSSDVKSTTGGPAAAGRPPVPRRLPGWAHMLTGTGALLLFYTPALFTHLRRFDQLSVTEMTLYPLLLGSAGVAVVLALQRAVHRLPVAALNLRAGNWRSDLGLSLLLTVSLLLLSYAQQMTINRWLPATPSRNIATLMDALASQPWLLVLWIGPVMWLGVAGYEEVSRVFFLGRLWHVWPRPAGRCAVLVIGAALFGLVHMYQGPAGMLNTALLALVLGGFYWWRGRVLPMVAAHALYNTFWIVLAVTMSG